MKKSISVVIVLTAMLLTALGGLAPVHAEALKTYQASSSFVYDTNYNPGGPWQWNRYNAALGYVKMPQLLKDTATNVPAYEAFSVDGNANTGKISKYYMQTSANTTAALAADYPVRTFTAPKSGTVTISCADAGGGSNIVGSSATGIPGASTTQGPKVRIMHNDVQIWPAAGTWTTIPTANSVAFTPVQIDLTAGDKLHFEAERYSSGNWQRSIYWDPIVAYDAYTLDVVSFSPSVREDLPLDQEFSITFTDDILPITAADITIDDAEAAVTGFSQNGKTVTFSFSGLAKKTEYNVTIANLAEEYPTDYGFSFATFSSPKYQASEAFLANTNPNAPWQWDRYNVATGTYIPLATYTESTVTLNGANRPAFSRIDNVNSLAIGEHYMRNDANTTTQTGGKYVWQQNYAVRTFTAPKAGSITISADDGKGGSNLVGGTTASTVGPKARVMHNDKQIWPADGWETVKGDGAIVPFALLSIGVNEGDKLRFELSSEDLTTAGSQYYRTVAYWDPIVEYESYGAAYESISPSLSKPLPADQQFTITFADEINTLTAADITIDGAAVTDFSQDGKTISFAFQGLAEGQTYSFTINNLMLGGVKHSNTFTFTTVTEPAYQASADYSTSANPIGPWQWDKCAVDTGEYSRLTATSSSLSAIAGASIGTAYYYSATASGNGLAVGTGWMRVDQSDAENTFDDYYAVRTFTAPETGNITITADDGTGESNILGMNDAAATVGPNVRIMLDRADGTREQVWPESDWQRIFCGSTVPFAPVNLDIAQGDKLRFELSNTHAVGATAFWRGSAYWDPKIQYKAALLVEDVKFDDGAVTDFADVAAEGSVDVDITVTASLANFNSIIPVVAVYDADNRLKSIAIGATESVSIYETKTLSLTLNNTDTTTQGYVKILLLDDLASLQPLSAIGSAKYIESII